MRTAAKYLIVISIVTVFAWPIAFPKIRCNFGRDRMTISVVTDGTFLETIPLSGKVEIDTSRVNIFRVNVAVDELYFPRIAKGLKATTTINNFDYQLQITNFLPEVVNGRFPAIMEFAGDSIPVVSQGQTLRLRLAFSDPSQATLVPVGGFYKDTGGKWIYVVDSNKNVTKRHIKFGRKNPEHFEVLEGLKPGDSVITSSYENYPNKNFFSLWEMKNRNPLSLM